MHLSGNQRRRRFGIGRGFVLALVIVTTGCTADYGKLSAADEASSCAAWLTGNAPLEAPPRVMLVDEPLVVSSQNTVGVAYESLNLVKVQRGTAEQTAARIVHEMAHLYGATEDQADFAERNTWRCALG